MEKEIISSNDMETDELEEIFEKVESGQMIEVDGAFDDQCFVNVVRDSFDPSGAKVKTQKKVERVKRIVELSRGRKSEKYREFG